MCGGDAYGVAILRVVGVYRIGGTGEQPVWPDMRQKLLSGDVVRQLYNWLEWLLDSSLAV